MQIIFIYTSYSYRMFLLFSALKSSFYSSLLPFEKRLWKELLPLQSFLNYFFGKIFALIGFDFSIRIFYFYCVSAPSNSIFFGFDNFFFFIRFNAVVFVPFSFRWIRLKTNPLAFLNRTFLVSFGHRIPSTFVKSFPF